jgi:hypothetical protein
MYHKRKLHHEVSPQKMFRRVQKVADLFFKSCNGADHEICKFMVSVRNNSEHQAFRTEHLNATVICVNSIRKSRGSSVTIVTRLRAERLRFDSWQEQGIYVFDTTSRPALELTQPSIQWVPGVLSPELKWPYREADHSPLSSAEVKNTWSYTSSPPYVFMALYLIQQWIWLYGVVLG